MVPQLIARVDGLPVSLLDREVVWPVREDGRNRSRPALRARSRARIERQTAVVHAAVLSSRARAALEKAAEAESPYLDAEAERSEIRALLAQRGVL
jgi:hypothetical protein